MPAAKGSVGNGWTDKRGYRWLYVKENGRQRARQEHRVLMERAIGRRLEPWEGVHHRDGNPANNSLENLELVEFGAHTINHHLGSRRDSDARRSMEAFALMREELKAERIIKAELLEACKAMLDAFYLDPLEANCGRAVEMAEAAISKARGEAGQ